MNRIFEAAKFAASRHASQPGRGPKNEPYVTHCFDVAQRLVAAGVDDHFTLIGAILHDTMEDTPTTYDELKEKFGYSADLVRDLTLPLDCRDGNPVKKTAHQTLMMSKMDIGGVFIKIADKTSNVNDLVDNAPKWGLRAIRGYADSAEGVVHAGKAVRERLLLTDDQERCLSTLIIRFYETYQKAQKHYGWTQ
jgi:guanosine-3',5'-bis(diphosphate) 3'-pyrophosphohydrolase